MGNLRSLIALVGALVFLCVGCGSSSPEEKKTAEQSDRLQQIQQNSGGDWSKLTPQDKDYLVNTLAHGSEPTAKMLLGPPKHSGPKPGG